MEGSLGLAQVLVMVMAILGSKDRSLSLSGIIVTLSIILPLFLSSWTFGKFYRFVPPTQVTFILLIVSGPGLGIRSSVF